MALGSRSTKWLVIAVLLLAVLAAGAVWYRGYVANQLAASLNNWILARTAEGYRVDADIGPKSGGWLTAVQPLRDVNIGAPRDDWEVKLPALAINVAIWNPFRVEFVPAQDVDLRYTVADAEYRVRGALRDGRLGFTYDTGGQVRSVFIRDLSGRFDGAAGLDIGKLRVDAKFDPPATSDVDGKSVEISLALDDGAVLDSAALPLGNLIKRVELEAYVSGALAPGQPSESLAAWRDAGGVLQIQHVMALWGPLALSGEGTLALDGGMQPLFAGTATVRGYSETIDALAQAGLIAPNQAAGAKITMAALAQPAEDGGPPQVKLPLTIQDGFLSVGPIKLARLPRIVWQ